MGEYTTMTKVSAIATEIEACWEELDNLEREQIEGLEPNGAYKERLFEKVAALETLAATTAPLDTQDAVLQLIFAGGLVGRERAIQTAGETLNHVEWLIRSALTNLAFEEHALCVEAIKRRYLPDAHDPYRRSADPPKRVA